MTEATIQGLLDGLASELDAPVALDDGEFRLRAHTSHGDVIDEVRRSWIVDRRLPEDVRVWLEEQGIHTAASPIRTPAAPSMGIAYPRWCIPVRFRGMQFGYVWVLEARPISEDRLAPVIDVADQIGMISYRERLLAQADTELLRLLLTPNPGDQSILREAGALAVHSHEGPIAVVIIGCSRDGELGPMELSDLALATQRAAEQTSSPLAGVISELGILIAPLRSRDDLHPARRLAETTHRLAAYFGNGAAFLAAIGGARDLEDASHSYAEARRALRVARAIPRLGPITAWDDLGFLRPLSLLPPNELEGVLDPRIRALLANECLAMTAEVFLDLAGNVQETAARLHLHRTALYHRLQRIAALYQLDLQRNGDDRLLAHLGLKLARLEIGRAA